MSTTFKVIAGICVYYILLGTVLGVLGQNIAYDTGKVNNSLAGFAGYNTSTEVSISGMTSFWQGLTFSIASMPWYINIFLDAVIPTVMGLGIVWLLRGNG